MKCPKCMFENEEDAKFCNECGQRLEPVCPHCSRVNKTGSKFCNECGKRLDEPPETVKPVTVSESERKHVTVIFSDMSGYTAMTEKLDPEETKGYSCMTPIKYGGNYE